MSAHEFSTGNRVIAQTLIKALEVRVRLQRQLREVLGERDRLQFLDDRSAQAMTSVLSAYRDTPKNTSSIASQHQPAGANHHAGIAAHDMEG